MSRPGSARRERRLVVLVVVALAVVACKKGTPPCPVKWSELPPELQELQVVECRCGAVGDGAVKGTGVYTTDSNVCRAAQHAGAASPAGGVVKLVRGDGCRRYAASEQNGVSSSSWAGHPTSFWFEGHGGGSCATP